MTPLLQTVFDNGGSLDSLLTYSSVNEDGAVDEDEPIDYGFSTQPRPTGTTSLGNLAPAAKYKKAFAGEVPLH